MISIAASPWTVTIPPIVCGDGRADQQRAEQVEDRREHDALQRGRRAGRDERGDRVRRVVDPVGEREREREQHREQEPRLHARRIWRGGARRGGGRGAPGGE